LYSLEIGGGTLYSLEIGGGAPLSLGIGGGMLLRLAIGGGGTLSLGIGGGKLFSLGIGGGGAMSRSRRIGRGKLVSLGIGGGAVLFSRSREIAVLSRGIGVGWTSRDNCVVFVVSRPRKDLCLGELFVCCPSMRKEDTGDLDTMEMSKCPLDKDFACPTGKDVNIFLAESFCFRAMASCRNVSNVHQRVLTG
jgi:hypothetical protein